MSYDVLIRNCIPRGQHRPVDIGVRDKKIVSMKPELEGKGEVEVDAGGRFATESFVIAHLHLDKVLTGGWITEEAIKAYHQEFMDTERAISLGSRVKERYDVDEIVSRVRGVLEQAIFYGTTHIRAFADVDTKAELKGVSALLRLKKEFNGLIDLQVVAFPQEGILTDLGADEYLRKAMDLGADVVGGIPWLELSDEDAKKHIDIVFDIARQYDRDVAMLVDDTADPASRTLEMLCLKTMKEDYGGRVAANHARAMAVYNDSRASRVISLVSKANVGVVTSPQTGPLQARVKDLLRAGVPVALGQDDCHDAYYSFGRCNMIEVVFLASHLLWMMAPSEMNTLIEMASINAAKIMRIRDHRLSKGGNANLVVLDAPSLHEALRNQVEPRYVVSHGRLVAETKVQREPLWKES